MSEIVSAPVVHARPTTRALFVLPPDFHAPRSNLQRRFAPLGPAVVAAAVAPLGIVSRAVDLAALVFRAPLRADTAPLDDADVLLAHLAGRDETQLGALAEEMLALLEPYRSECDVVALSIDRGSQLPVAALLARELKRRWGKRLIAGGVATERLRELLVRAGTPSVDVLSAASTPTQLRSVFSVLLELPASRTGEVLDPPLDAVQLIRGGMRKAVSAAGWPLPDFGLYDLELYRRPVLDSLSGGEHAEAAPLSRHLVLPYHFAFECQFSCAFCQTGGNQESKPLDQVVRELAALAERWEVREFLFLNAQSNLLAPPLSRALLDARLDLRWSDSYRVRPREPGDLELMARAGCASVTVGVESASDVVLKAMIKGHRAEHATEMLREASDAELLTRVNILTCYPGETEADLALTCDWVEANAYAIDDLAPSSFYLTADSPMGRNMERYGLVSRGPRALRGATKFRKSPDSLAYDEVGGMRWEEREALLAVSEDRVRRAWERGRAALGRTAAGFAPDQMLGLRRRFDTRAEIYSTVQRWQRESAAARAPVSIAAPAPPERSAPDEYGRVRLGQGPLWIAPLGIGTWSWGERDYWGYGSEHGPADVVDAFGASTARGLTLFDTSEHYGGGESEKILGWMAKKHGTPLVLASKFALTPDRDASAFARALEQTLRRLRVERVDLYQVQWSAARAAPIEWLAEALAAALAAGRVRAVGVCNVSASELRAMHGALARRRVPLSTMQTRYSLLHRAPERDGVLATCRELGVTLLAQSPLSQGALTGRYGPARLPAGPRARLPIFSPASLAAREPLLAAMRVVAEAHGGRSLAQVALAWLRAQPGVVPLVGARTGAQADDDAASLSLTLRAEELHALAAAAAAAAAEAEAE